MTEQLTSSFENIGPTEKDVKKYEDLLKILENGGDPGFRPWHNAEMIGRRLSNFTDKNGQPITNPEEGFAQLGIFIDPEEVEAPEEESLMKLAQQRYVAAIIGFIVEKTRATPDGTALAFARFPKKDELLPLPKRKDDGTFTDGKELSDLEVDMYYSAHYLVENRKELSQEGKITKYFEQVMTQANQGSITVNGSVENVHGAMSFVRQIARGLGYKVGEFRKDASGDYVMQVDGLLKGFEERLTYNRPSSP